MSDIALSPLSAQGRNFSIDFLRLFGLRQTVAASQPAAATIDLIFVGVLSAFFDQDR
jgi:hypothetical protein